jgi:enamine deaminase RidA (YjgF/YER057c/UK114 family)
MSDASRLERAGVVVGCVLVATFVVALFADAAGTNDARTAFVGSVLALGVAAGVVVATTRVLAYETVWAFALGTWLVAIPLVALAPEVRIAVLVVFDTFLENAGYRVLVLVIAALGGALAAVLYDRYG